jgi:hypothetical protein
VSLTFLELFHTSSPTIKNFGAIYLSFATATTKRLKRLELFELSENPSTSQRVGSIALPRSSYLPASLSGRTRQN